MIAKLYLLKTCLTEAAAQEIKADTLRLILSMLNRTQERDLKLILKLKKKKTLSIGKGPWHLGIFRHCRHGYIQNM